jgi:predicted RNA-binding Zn-ribbon protein involved in translation (DUF1610 family)
MASNIIRFPRSKQRRKRLTDVLVDRITPTDTHVKLGRVPFTCPECGNVASFDFTNAIFKHVTFFCADCGHGYKVTNPMFADPQVRVRIINGRG